MEKGSEPTGANGDGTMADEALLIKDWDEETAAYYDRLRMQWNKSRGARRRLHRMGIEFVSRHFLSWQASWRMGLTI